MSEDLVFALYTRSQKRVLSCIATAAQRIVSQEAVLAPKLIGYAAFSVSVVRAACLTLHGLIDAMITVFAVLQSAISKFLQKPEMT